MPTPVRKEVEAVAPQTHHDAARSTVRTARLREIIWFCPWFSLETDMRIKFIKSALGFHKRFHRLADSKNGEENSVFS